MSHQFTFTSKQFTPADEQPNPINPIAGEGLLRWLVAALRSERVAADEVAPEDWGWYAGVRVGPRVYMLGTSGEWAPDDASTEWVVQLDLHRTIWEKMTGANKLADDDELSTAIHSLLRQNPQCVDVSIDRSN